MSVGLTVDARAVNVSAALAEAPGQPLTFPGKKKNPVSLFTSTL